jgi:hypothetical protein
LYAITLTTPPVLDVEPSVRVIWANTLSNNSNAPVNVQLEALTINELNNIKIYIDSNKDGQFDTNDQQLTTQFLYKLVKVSIYGLLLLQVQI